MPSAANAKSEKPASSEATDNTPVRQIITIIEHKIRNLEKRKGKLTQYRDLQKAGKELKGDQRVAVAKYDEVIQTLEFARDLSKQIASVAVAAERDAKKQAKRDAWVRSAMETSKIREVLLILDCLTQMGNHEARDDFLTGSNGAAKLTEQDLKILDDLYPEVTPKHEPNEEGKPAFFTQSAKAAEHLCSIIDGRPKEILGTTYSRIKEIVSTVHQCGYFDRIAGEEVEAEEEQPAAPPQEAAAPAAALPPAAFPAAPAPPAALPAPPAPAVVPAPAYPLRALPPITLQEVEHAYFAQQYPQQRPLAEVIGSQNFFFLQESEIDSPVGTPQPPPIPTQPSPPGPIPTQTFTNQHFIQLQPGRVPEPLAHYPLPEHGGYPAALALHPAAAHLPLPPPAAALPPPHPAHLAAAPHPLAHPPPDAAPPADPPADDKPDDDWVEAGRSPERDDADRRAQGQGDGQRFRRGHGRGRGAPNGHRGRGAYHGRQESYRGRHADYQPRAHARHYDGYQGRHGKDSYASRNDDAYYGNGDAADAPRDENGRARPADGAAPGAAGGYRGRGRGPRAPRAGPRAPRASYSDSRRADHAD